jgi:23S rRNA (guanine745-N1)-methyltransferase
VEPAGRPRTSDDDGAPRVLCCGRGHRFDAASQGYFNLLTGRGTAFEADTAAMVQARIDFLESGHFRPLVDAVCAAAREFAVERPVVLDVGAGTGYYLGAVQERVPASAAVALDISKFALRRAARLLPRALCLVWDVWRPLPIEEGSVDLLLNVFAPRNPAEFARVCRDGGVLLVVTPLPHHLREIAEAARLLDIRPGKGDDVAAGLVDSFDMVRARIVEFTMTLSPVDVRNVAAMGPAGHHGAPVEIDSIPQDLSVTAAFTVQTFRRRVRPER